jgi:hypothetical protein
MVGKPRISRRELRPYGGTPVRREGRGQPGKGALRSPLGSSTLAGMCTACLCAAPIERVILSCLVSRGLSQRGRKMSLSRTQTLPLPSSGSDDRRADEIIENQIQAELRRSSHPAIRRVTCHFSSGVLILRGQVSSYYLKQIVKSTASYRLEGVTVVRNQVEVVTEEAANPGQ